MLYIIRHGQTEMNSRHALQGRSDFALNEVGLAQAREAAEKLRGVRFDRVYSSPLRRAVQTSELLAPDAEIVIDERLIEMDYGPYEGADLHNLPPEILILQRLYAQSRPGGHGAADRRRRARRRVSGGAALQ